MTGHDNSLPTIWNQSVLSLILILTLPPTPLHMPYLPVRLGHSLLTQDPPASPCSIQIPTLLCHWCPPFPTHCLHDSVSPPLEAYILADFLDKYFLTLYLRIPLSFINFPRLLVNLYHPSGHVAPLTGFLLMYPVLDLIFLVLWIDGFHEIWKKLFDQYFIIYFSSIVFIPFSWKSKYMKVKLFAIINHLLIFFNIFPFFSVQFE